MADVASLGIAVNSAPARTATTDLRQLTAAADSAEQSTGRLSRTSDMLAKQHAKVDAAMRAEAAAIQQAYGITEQLTRAQVKQIQALEDQYAKATMAGKAYAEYTAQVKAGVTANTQAAQVVTQLAGRVHDAQETQKKATAAANDNNSAFERLGNTLTRRVVYAFIAAQAREAATAIFNLNSELAKTGDIASRNGLGSGLTQGILSASAGKGVDTGAMLEGMLQFNAQVSLANSGLGSLGVLLRSNGIAVTDTKSAFLAIADLVQRASGDYAKQASILTQANLPATREMVRFMEQGSAAIRAQSDAAKKFSQEQLDAGQKLDDRWNAWWDNFKRAGKSAVLEVTDPQAWHRAFGSEAIAPGSPIDRFWTYMKEQAAIFRGGLAGATNGRGYFGGTPGDFIAGANPSGSVTRGADLAAAKAVALPVDPEKIKALIGLEQQRIGILGQTASVSQQVRQVELAIQSARLNNVNITNAEEANLRRLASAQADGTAHIQALISAEKVRGSVLFMSEEAAIAYSVAQSEINRQLAAGRSIQDINVAGIRAGAAELAKLAVANNRLGDAIAAARDLSVNFGTDFAHSLEGGKDILESMRAAATGLGKSLIDIGIKRLTNLGIDSLTSSLSGASSGAASAAVLNAGAVTAGATLTASASAAAGILAGGGAISAEALAAGAGASGTILVFDATGAATVLTTGGAAAGAAMWGPLAAIAAILVGIGMMSMGGEDKVKKAQEEWKKAGPAFQKFLTEMSGGVQGDLSQKIQDAAAREADFEDKAWKARDTAAINAARSGLQNFSDTQKRLFQATFQATVDALNDGLGLDSPFMKAVNNVKTALNAQLAFIDDTDVAIGENIPGTMARAKAASQSYLLSLLQQPQALSAVQTGMMQIHGTANALQGALVQLGMSSGDAAKAINDGVTKAVAGLKTQFEAGLTERLNTAGGQSFLNDATKLIAQHQQDILDAASLGSDPALVASVFRAEAQKIVDDANLTGEAFKDFIGKFSPLKDVVHEFAQSAVDDSKALQDAQNSAAKSITEFVAGLYAGPNTTQSPTARRASAGTIYSSQLTLAQNNDPTALARITSDAQNLIDAERAISASSVAFQQLRDNVAAQLLSLPAVQSTTDPAVQAMRDVLTAINIGNQVLNTINATTIGTTSAVNAANSVGTLTGVILPAVNAGNAANVAAALQAYFNQIDPSGKLASVVGYSSQTVASVLETNRIASVGVGAQDYGNNLAATANSLVQASNSFLTAINTFANRIIDAANAQGILQQGIGNQTNAKLATLLNWQPILAYGTNTSAGSDSATPVSYTAHAMGGVIPAHGLGLVSEHSPGGGRFIRAGNEPITVSPFAPAPSFRSNDNNRSDPALLAEMREMNKKIERLEAALERQTRVTGAVGEHIREGVDDLNETQQEFVRETKFQKSATG
jgi:hypothetical protein